MHWVMAFFAGLGCCALGLAVSSAASQRLRMLRAGVQAVQAIRIGVCLRGELLARVLREAPTGESPEARAWAAFFASVGETLAQEPGASLAETWGEAWAKANMAHPALRALGGEDLRLLEPLRDGLGRSPRDEQQALLEGVCKELQAQHESLRPKLADTQKIAQALGLLGGLALFLLLI